VGRRSAGLKQGRKTGVPQGGDSLKKAKISGAAEKKWGYFTRRQKRAFSRARRQELYVLWARESPSAIRHSTESAARSTK
jgi:hypothetical protein